MSASDSHDQATVAPADAAPDPPPAIGTDERRMHVRAYNHWVSLLGGRPFPAVGDLDPPSLGDFGPHSVLLDFRDRSRAPDIPWLGEALRTEGQIGAEVRSIADVPGRSLLSRLTDHYLQIIANRAPIGFEAEFVNARGNHAMYRGILMPFSSDGTTIDYIYGVINWKELADPALTADIVAAADRAIADARAKAAAAPPRPAVPVWADGPGRGLGGDTAADPIELASQGGEDDARMLLADRLAAARASAQRVVAIALRSRAALYAAIAHAYRFALAAERAPAAYAALLAECGVRRQDRAPMTPVAKLVFGAGYDKTRLAEYAAVLTHARRRAVPDEAVCDFLEGYPGGIKGIVAAERAARRPVRARPADPRDVLRAAPAAATVALAAQEEFVLLVARRASPTTMAVIGAVPADSTLLEQALGRLARG